MADDGLERLRRWRDEQRGVPPAFGRLRATVDALAVGTTSVRLPLHPELLLPDGSPSAAVTALAADFALTTSVIASLPDLRGVATVAMTVDHLGLPPVSGALVSRCSAAPHGDGPQHASGALWDDTGRQVATMSGWLLAAPAEAVAADRVGLVEEEPAADLPSLLEVDAGPVFVLRARDALSNALGTLHGGIGALAALLAAEAALRPGLRTLTSTFAYPRPTPRDGSVTVTGTALREGRRTALATAALTDEGGRTVLQSTVVAG